MHILLDKNNPYIIAFILGVILTTVLPPLYFSPALLLVFPLILFYLRLSSSYKQAFFVGYLFGFGHFLTGLYWFAFPLLVEPEKFAWLIPFATLGIAGVISIFTALLFTLTYLIWNKYHLNNIKKAILFSCIWVIFEYARGHLFTGFPWNLIGYSLGFSNSAMQLAAFGGIYTCGLVVVIVATAPYPALQEYLNSRKISRTSLYYLVFVILSAICLYCFGSIRLSNNPTTFVEKVKLRLVQANLQQKDIIHNSKKSIIEYYNLTKSVSNNDITAIIWPESAVPYPLNKENYLREVLSGLLNSKSVLIVGSDNLELEGEKQDIKVWNSLFIINNNAQILDIYNKTHLVPFGEYVPFRNILPIDKITKGQIDFSRGVGNKILANIQDLPPFSPLICYEIIFPGEVVSDNQAKWMLNITNDSWFGNSSGPYQHYAMAKVRAIEQGIPLVRVATTGISAVIDSLGREIKKVDLNTKGIIDSNLPQALQKKTLYSRFHDKVFFILLGIVIISLFISHLIKGRKH